MLSTVGSYRLTGLLGEGGMGAVYRATHALLGRPAAIKVLLPAFSRNQEIVNRFFNEARATTAIRHPGIVEIYDFGYVEDGSAYIAMELLDGEPLSARIATRRWLPPAEALGVIRQIAGALGAAHAAGIVHRDLKPDNVFLVPDPEVPTGERIKLLDFGIAKLAVEPGQSQTRTGALMGTPTYMAPEQCRGVVVDLRADLYSLGCILFEMLCARVPFVGEGVGDVLAAHIHMPPASPRSINAQVSPELDALVLQLLAKDPAARPQTSEQVIAAIDALTGRPRASSHISQPTIASPYAPVHSPPSMPPPTTLGGAAGSYAMPTAVATPPRSRKGLWIGLAASAIAGAAVAAVMVMQGGGEAKQPDDAPVAAAKPEPEPRHSTLAEPPKPEPPKPEPVKAVKLVIDTRPQGAAVLLGTEQIGVTPLTLERAPVGETLHLTVRLAGYQDLTMDVPGDISVDRMVSLTKVAPVVKKKPRPGKKPTTGDGESDRNGGVNPFD